MRRTDKEITDASILRKILKSSSFMTVAMCKNNEPYIVSLSYGYDETRNCIYFHCATEGKKLDYLKANNKIWAQALLDYGYVQSECDHRYASVRVNGKVTFIEDRNEKLHAIATMINQLDKNPAKLLIKLKDEPAATTNDKAVTAQVDRLGTARIGRIDIESITGKKTKELTI
jgi:nitroimidazol reductase NimA-like FMN-containing flavoprotein (pyridoxamine 5'-phosphate oxidase superfamily)